uniref:F-ATPase protein 6 n=1 Tax=Marsupiomonas sp. NIES 1824 TaxID=1562198 RepID=A0A6H0QZV2_9CHLO|nr:ATP synthase F0 subunit 6 [Marsupiomonas sp. NIES 1824]
MVFSRTEQFQLIKMIPLTRGPLDLSVTNRLVYLVRTRRLLERCAKRTLHSRQTVVPSYGTQMFSHLESFLHGMTEDQVGKERARSFVPLVFRIFVLIVGTNRMGMIPRTFPLIVRTRYTLGREKLRKGMVGVGGTWRNPRASLWESRKGKRKVTPRRQRREKTLRRPLRWVQTERLREEKQGRSRARRRGFSRGRRLWSGRGLLRMVRFRSRRPRRFTPTSHLFFTFRRSSSLFVGLIYLSVERHGLRFFSFFCPRGIPLALTPFIVILEMISFFFRPVSLGVRLRANMTAGHLLLHTVRGFVSALLGSATLAYCRVGRRGAVILQGVFLLETRVCVLQAYVFTRLFTIYLKDAKDLH